MKYSFLVLLLLAGWPVIAAEGSPANVPPTTVFQFAMPPQQTIRELEKRWGPIIKYISQHAGVPLQFQAASNFSAYQQEMKAGRYDIALINAYYYATFKEAVGYKVFAQEKNGHIVCVVVVRKDSPYQTLEELEGKQLAFPGPTAPSSMRVYTHLKAKNIHVSPSYVNSMDSAYRAVAKGLFPAGQGELRTFNGMEPEIRDQLRILWSADPMPPFTFIVHPRVPQAAVQKIQQAMLKMADDPEGVELLKTVNMMGIAAAQESDSEYEAVRNLKLLTLEQPPKLE